MVPRVDIMACDVDAGREELVCKARESGARFLPVYEGDLDRVLGVLELKDAYLYPERGIRELVRAITAVPPSKTLDELLPMFWEEGSQAALVVDEYGGTHGFVTMDQILDELVGDEELSEEPVRQPDERTYLLSGRLGIREWPRSFPRT